MDGWMQTVSECNSTHSAQQAAHLLDKLGLGGVGQLVVEGTSQSLLTSLFITDLNEGQEDKCV